MSISLLLHCQIFYYYLCNAKKFPNAIILNNPVNASENLTLQITFPDCDASEFALVYDRYAPAMFGIVSRIITNRDLAESVLSKIFLTAWQQKCTFDHTKSSLFTWLIDLSRKIAFSEVKPASEKSIHPKINVYEHKKVPEKSNAMISLPAGNVVLAEPLTKENTAFELIYSKGMSYEQVSAELNIPATEIKIIIREAIKKMKGLL